MPVKSKEIKRIIDKHTKKGNVDLSKVFKEMELSARDLYYNMETQNVLENSLKHVISNEDCDRYHNLEKHYPGIRLEIEDRMSDIVYDYSGSIAFEEFLDELRDLILEVLNEYEEKKFKEEGF